MRAHQTQGCLAPIGRQCRSRRWSVTQPIVDLLVLGLLDSQVAVDPLAVLAQRLSEREELVRVFDLRMMPTAVPTDARLIGCEGVHAVSLLVVPLGLASDDGVAGQVAVRVVVLVTLLRLPAQQTLLRDAERAGERQAVSCGLVAEEPPCAFGADTLVVCISVTCCTMPPMSAGAIWSASHDDQSSGVKGSPFQATT